VDERSKQSQEDALALSNSLLQVLRLLRLYDVENAAFNDPVNAVLGVIKRQVERSGSARLQAEEGMLYLNKEPFRGGRQSFGIIQGLVQAMEGLGIAEFAFNAELVDHELRSFFTMLKLALPQEQEGVRLIQGALDASPLKGRLAVYAEGETTGRAVVRTVEIDEATYFPLAYARTLVLLREYVRNMSDEELNRYFTQKLHRAIQELVGMTHRYSPKLLALAMVRNSEDRIFTHMAATGLLSICLGHRLGLSTLKLSDLGLAAMLHGLGKFRTNPDLMEKADLNPAERMELGQHPYRALATYLEGRKVNTKMLVCCTVGFQYDLHTGNTPVRLPPSEVHPYVQIIRVCDVFTGLTSDLKDRPALLPDQAVKQLIDARPGRYDPLVLTVFINMLGLYPTGSVVTLSTGEVAVVVHPNPDKPRRPLVAVVLDGEGRDVDGDFLDLAMPDVPSRITGSVDPKQLGLKIPEHLLS
jgi:HD-GYP domain-containing protein (c-di-GMP phosphodiesterase class II)